MEFPFGDDAPQEVLPTHFKCPNTGNTMEITDDQVIWSYEDEERGEENEQLFASNQIAELNAELAIYKGAELMNLDWLRVRDNKLLMIPLSVQVRQRLTKWCGTQFCKVAPSLLLTAYFQVRQLFKNA